MPNCFCLRRKTALGVPVSLVEVDAELCFMLGLEFSSTAWVRGWYNNYGFLFAAGQPINLVRHTVDKYYNGRMEDNTLGPEDYEAWRIIRYLDANYVADSWYESNHGR